MSVSGLPVITTLLPLITGINQFSAPEVLVIEMPDAPPPIISSRGEMDSPSQRV